MLKYHISAFYSSCIILSALKLKAHFFVSLQTVIRIFFKKTTDREQINTYETNN